MIEKIKAINNPLTIIAIFAALAEVAGTVALATVDKSLQPTFVWFVMLFPTIIVILFFITLNFNPKVLYAPSDFRDEANFLSIFSGQQLIQAGEKIEVNQDNFAEVKRELAQGQKDIVSEMHSRPELLAAANQFFKILMSQTENLFEEKKLRSIGFGYHAPEFYLLSFELHKEKLPPRKSSKFDWIIRVYQSTSGIVQLEAVGHGIVSDNAEEFAARVYREILFIVDRAFRDSAPKIKPEHDRQDNQRAAD